jgi:Arc/MetJ family transcription regulator
MPRTTVTIDPDVDALLRRAMRERGVPYKVAVNDAIRAGLGSPATRRKRATRTFRMGFEPALPWDKALRLAADLEDEELLRRLTARK